MTRTTTPLRQRMLDGMKLRNMADVTVSLFDDEEGARISNERAPAWAEENLADFSDGRPPELLVGRVVVIADR